MHSCLLVGGAPAEHRGLDTILDICHFDVIYAVDAGYASLKARGIAAQRVFGDFDSLGYVPQKDQDLSAGCDEKRSDMHIEVFDSHKDFTDMNLALDHAIQQGFTNIVMCDGLHARLDHSLGNLQLMAHAAHSGQRIWGITEEELVITLDASGGLNEVRVDAGAQGICSVISHSDTAMGVSEEGMEYSLRNATVSNRALWGISNELIGAPARITLKEGSLWVFLPLNEAKRVSYSGVKLA